MNKVGVIEKYNKVFEYTGACMSLLLAYQYFLIWKEPYNYPVTRIMDFTILILFEFIMIHSGVFMAVMPKKLSILILVPFYGIFTLAFNAMTSDNSLLLLYGFIVFNRMRFAFSDVEPDIRLKNILFSVFSMIAYVLLMFIVIGGSQLIPMLGLHNEFLKESGYLDNLTVQGQFVEQPHGAIVMGMLYSICIAGIQVMLITKKRLKTSLKIEDFDIN